MIEMISSRLTKTQKDEILCAYRAGDSSNSLAEKYSCTTNTIIRTVKTLLSDHEYKILKDKRSKISDKKFKRFDNENVQESQEDLSIKIDQEIDNNDFELIEPLLSGFDFDEDKSKSDFEILNYESLPESVYMIVDKKVELDLQLISDFPEWSFLPENELKRKALLLFANQRSAKRSCSRNQRVINIPNTSIFKLSKSYLISKGVTRLIIEDSIIALDD